MIAAVEKKSTPNRLNVVPDWFEELKRLGVMNKIGQAVSAVVTEMIVAITAAVTAATVASTASHSELV